MTRDDWIIVIKDGRNANLAQRILQDFQKACSRLNIRVEQPEIIRIDREDDAAEFEKSLLNYMKRGRDSVFHHPKMAVCILDRESNYSMVKNVCGMYQIPSQVITVRNAMGFNLSKASNVLR